MKLYLTWVNYAAQKLLQGLLKDLNYSDSASLLNVVAYFETVYDF